MARRYSEEVRLSGGDFTSNLADPRNWDMLSPGGNEQPAAAPAGPSAAARLEGLEQRLLQQLGKGYEEALQVCGLGGWLLGGGRSDRLAGC
jgi:hypothetical protein